MKAFILELAMFSHHYYSIYFIINVLCECYKILTYYSIWTTRSLRPKPLKVAWHLMINNENNVERNSTARHFETTHKRCHGRLIKGMITVRKGTAPWLMECNGLKWLKKEVVDFHENIIGEKKYRRMQKVQSIILFWVLIYE